MFSSVKLNDLSVQKGLNATLHIKKTIRMKRKKKTVLTIKGQEDLKEKWGEFLISWYSGCEWRFMAGAAAEDTHRFMLPIQPL